MCTCAPNTSGDIESRSLLIEHCGPKTQPGEERLAPARSGSGCEAVQSLCAYGTVVAMSPDDPATAEGNLHRTPLPHLLVYIADRRLTGALFLTEPRGATHIVRFEWGVPTHVRHDDDYALFGELLVEAGVVEKAVVDDALAMNGLLGDVLLLTGHAAQSALESTAKEQLTRRVSRLFVLPGETVYRYFDEHDALAEGAGPPCRIDTLALIIAGLRAHPRATPPLGRLMEKMGELPLRLHPDAMIERFCFTDEEACVVTTLLMDRPSFVDLLASGVADAEVVCRVVYALLLTRQIDLGQQLPPLGAEVTPPQVAVGRVRLASALHRFGAAAPDPSGDGERAAVMPRTLGRRKTASGPPASADPEEEPVSDVIEIFGPAVPERGTGAGQGQ